VFEADLSRTERWALLDLDLADPADFATRTIAWAKQNGHAELVWHFAAVASVDNLAGHARAWLDQLTARLKRSNYAAIDGVRIVLATQRMHQCNAQTPVAAWWPDDHQLMRLDTTHRPLLAALISDARRAPIWLTAFDVDVSSDGGVIDPPTGMPSRPACVSPILVSSEVQETVATHSRPMTLSSNGVHDSLAPPLVDAARRLIRSGQATPEAIAVAALRAGWWPDKVPALVDKVTPRP
jgi:hypothetical protein